MRVRWESDTGAVLEMGDGLPVTVVRGVGGLDAPPIDVSALARGQVAGAVVTGMRWKERVVVLPVSIQREVYADVIAALSQPSGTLTVERERTGKARAYYHGGLESLRAQPGRFVGVLRFLLPWPFWLSASEHYLEMTAGDKPLAYPFGFPFRVLGGSTLADMTITNGGELDAWPRWRLTGAATRWELQNLTTGKRLIITCSLEDGEVMTIATRPGEGAIVDADGASLMNCASGDLWPLAVGDNAVRVVAVDATQSTRAELWWSDEYMGV